MAERSTTQGLEEETQREYEDLHLAILDISMSRMTGLQAARQLSQRRPELKLLMLPMYDDIVTACRTAIRGQSFLYPSAVNTLIRDFVDRTDEEVTYGPLTPRELEVLKPIAEGQTSKEIAELLVLGIKTVERHRADILTDSGCATAST